MTALLLVALFFGVLGTFSGAINQDLSTVLAGILLMIVSGICLGIENDN